MTYMDNYPDKYLLESKSDAELPYIIPPNSAGEVAVASITNLVYMIRLSREAGMKHAQSWREFKVGAAVIGCAIESEEKKWGIFTGANIKPAEVTDINIHAEQMALAKLRRAGMTWVPAMAVWGETQEDHQSGISSLTLHPCGRCRGMFVDEVPEIDHRTTILSGNADASINEIYSLEELIEHHASDGANELTVVDFSDEATGNRIADEQIARYVSANNERFGFEWRGNPIP